MKKKYLFLSVICLALFVCGQAQTRSKVNIELPHFAGKPYVFYLMQGERQDTIQSGALDDRGKPCLCFPNGIKHSPECRNS